MVLPDKYLLGKKAWEQESSPSLIVPEMWASTVVEDSCRPSSLSHPTITNNQLLLGMELLRLGASLPDGLCWGCWITVKTFKAILTILEGK